MMDLVYRLGKIFGFLTLFYHCYNAEMYRNIPSLRQSGSTVDISFIEREMLEKFTDNSRFIYSPFMEKRLEIVTFTSTQCLLDMEKGT